MWPADKLVTLKAFVNFQAVTNISLVKMAGRFKTLVRWRCPMAMGAALCLVLTFGTPHRGHASPISILDRVESAPIRVEKSTSAFGAFGQPNSYTVPRVVLPDDPSAGAASGSRADQLMASPGAMLSGQTTRNWADDMARSDLSRGAALPPAWAPLGSHSESTPDDQASGNSLKDVLRSIITWHNDGRIQPQTAEPRSGDSDADGPINLRDLVLNSGIGATVLRAVVDAPPAEGDGSTFSVFGFGKFTLDLTPSLHSAVVSELSSGTSFGVSLNGDWLTNTNYLVAASNAYNGPNEPREKVNLVRLIWHWILDFVYSPIGALLSMSAIISMLVWVCVKSVVFLQRRTSRNGPI